MSSTQRLYKIMSEALWASASETLPWAPIDVRDGFVHLSDASQVKETARLHFAGQTDLVLIALDPARLLDGTLRWDLSRGGQRFPHVHGEVPRSAVLHVDALPLIDGAFVFPPDVG